MSLLLVLLHVLLRFLLFVKRARPLTFFIPISHVRYIFGYRNQRSSANENVSEMFRKYFGKFSYGFENVSESFGMISEMFRKCFGKVSYGFENVSESFGMVSEMFRKALVWFWKCFGNISEMFRKGFGDVSGNIQGDVRWEEAHGAIHHLI